MNRPENIKILAGKPMPHTWIKSYPDIQTLYESDSEIFFFLLGEIVADRKTMS